MHCKICNRESEKRFSAKILGKHDIGYYYCSHCGFLQTEEPYWLEEAYADSINITDTGIMERNIALRNKVLPILFYLFDPKKRFLDFAGGYGIFTRLMRDAGLDFLWMDKFSKNLVARGFEYNGEPIEAITAFETFEHFVTPMEEIEQMLSISDTIIFSTDLLPDPVPEPEAWWYYGLEHGQHIAFYAPKTLRFIADHYKLNLYSHKNLHILTRRQCDPNILELFFYNKKGRILKYKKERMLKKMKSSLRSKTADDMQKLIERVMP